MTAMPSPGSPASCGWRASSRSDADRSSSAAPATTQPRDARRNRLDNRPKTHCETVDGFTGLDSLNWLTLHACGNPGGPTTHSTPVWRLTPFIRVRESSTIHRVAFLCLRVSGAAVACDFLVSALPSPAPERRFLAGKAETVSNVSETGSQTRSGPCLGARLIEGRPKWARMARATSICWA